MARLLQHCFECICELLPTNRINLEGSGKESIARKSRVAQAARKKKSGIKEYNKELDEQEEEEEEEYLTAEQESLQKPDEPDENEYDTDRESIETAATELISDIDGSHRNLHISSRSQRLQMRQRFSSRGQWRRLNRMMLGNVYKALRIRWSRKFYADI